MVERTEDEGMESLNVSELQMRAREVFPGGVSAGGRFNHQLGGPLFAISADGPWVTGADGKRYLDFHLSAGAALFGYNHPELRKAVEGSMELGFFPNFDTPWHAELGRMICDAVPCAEQVRLCNSGTEATMAALRLARYATGKKLILKFNGHFHGMHELIWFNHGSVGTPGEYARVPTVADSAGIPSEFGDLVINVEFNDPQGFLSVLKAHGDAIAAVIMEPISYNCGCMPAKAPFLQLVRQQCTERGIVLIFDEVLSGFRMALGGAQEYYGVVPDLCTLAKALGGGFPISAVAGKKALMGHFNPSGPVVMSGTYTGALMPVLASLQCLRIMGEAGFYDRLNGAATYMYEQLAMLFKVHGIKGHVRGIGARFGLFFGIEDPEDDHDFASIARNFDAKMHRRFIAGALERGLYFRDTGYSLAPTHFGISSVHTRADIDMALNAIDDVLRSLGT